MATIAASRVTSRQQGVGLQIFKWAAIGASDTITPLIVPGHGLYSEVTVYFLKGSAFGGNLSLTGSPDPAATSTTFVTLKDASSTAIATKTTDGAFQVLDSAVAYAPVAGAGASGVDVWLIFRSTRG